MGDEEEEGRGWERGGRIVSGCGLEKGNKMTVSGFYKEVTEQGYSINFTPIKRDYIDAKVNSGELYLFEIYSKDFSRYSKGTQNLHTLYWKAVFSEENLKDVVIKLNGEAEIFFRKAYIDNKFTHKARKSWSVVENIKELKSGYLSHIVHQVTQLMIKHNAVVILEDLNFGFKRGRFKIEKQPRNRIC
jgi:hypothetical protein